MPKVLVADDEPGFAAVIATQLHTAGFDVVEAYTGAQAIRTAEQEPPDAILLDVMLSDMDGRDVARFQKAHPDLRHVPVILLSEADEDAVGWRAAEADAFVPKHDIRAVPEVVRRILKIT